MLQHDSVYPDAPVENATAVNTTATTAATNVTTPAANSTTAELQKMLESLTPEQAKHMLDLFQNGTTPAAPSSTNNTADDTTDHHVRTRHYDPVGTGRLENETDSSITQSTAQNDTMGGGTTQDAPTVVLADVALNSSTIATALLGINGTMDNATLRVNVTCADMGLQSNCTREDVLDELDRRDDEQDAALVDNALSLNDTLAGNMTEAMDPADAAMLAPAGAEADAPSADAPSADAPAPATTTAAALLAAAATSTDNPERAHHTQPSSDTNGTAPVFVVNSGGSSNATTIAVIVLVSVILAGIGLFVLHKRRAERRAQAMHEDFSSGGTFDWRDDGLEMSKPRRGLFDDVDEEYQSLNHSNIRKGGIKSGSIRATKLK